jgi:hypothetical protein
MDHWPGALQRAAPTQGKWSTQLLTLLGSTRLIIFLGARGEALRAMPRERDGLIGDKP